MNTPAAKYNTRNTVSQCCYVVRSLNDSGFYIFPAFNSPLMYPFTVKRRSEASKFKTILLAKEYCIRAAIYLGNVAILEVKGIHTHTI